MQNIKTRKEKSKERAKEKTKGGEKLSYPAMLIVLFLLLTIISSCSKVYVCYDGTTQKEAKKCPTVPYPKVIERAAKEAADKFGSAYARAKGDTFTQVNTYAQGQDWYSDGLFTNTKTAEVHRVKVKIDGKSASVTCIEGCIYLGLGEQINITNNQTDQNSTPVQ